MQWLQLDRLSRILFWSICVVHVLGLFIPVMEVDAAQYASISLEMLMDGSWLEVHHRYADYLDKPPLLFWWSAISFKLFGVHNWAYKLPSFLAALLGVLATYRITKTYYGERAALFSAFIIFSTQALFLITNDVRTDTLLLGFTIAAVWKLDEFFRKGTFSYLFWGSFCVGLAMLAKGPIGFIIPAMAIGSHLLLSGQWRKLLDWRLLLGLLVIAVTLAPMCWGLYHQFDLHPEKVVNGRTGQSGLYFYFWEQSFGRITGENVWKNSSGPLYFIHTTGWAFLPWTYFLIVALIQRIWLLRDKKLYPEWISLMGFILPFIALSTSNYKLPHYIFVTYPFAAIMVGALLDRGVRDTVWFRRKRQLFWLQYLVIAGIWLVIGLLLTKVFSTYRFHVWGTLLILAVLTIYTIFSERHLTKRLIIMSILTALAANFTMNTRIYPQLNRYQTSTYIGTWLHDEPSVQDRFASFRMHGHAIDFYGEGIYPRWNTMTDLKSWIGKSNKDALIFTDENGLKIMQMDGLAPKIIWIKDNFHIARLTPKFLNKRTRHLATEKKYLVRVTQ